MLRHRALWEDDDSGYPNAPVLTAQNYCEMPHLNVKG